MSWKKVKFSTLYEIPSRNGLTKPSRIRGSGYKMINMGELFANSRIYDIPMELVPLTDSEKINCKVERNDLLFARQSLVLEGAGKCSIVMETSSMTVFESHLIRVRLNLKKAYPPFYYYYFASSLSPITSIVSQCAQAGIRGSDLGELYVDLPPVDTQHRIADILSAYDDLIENNQKQIKLLEETAQRLYKEWFVDLRFPGHVHTKITDGVPEGWEKSTVAGVSSVLRRGISPRYNENGKSTVINQKCIRQTVVTFDESRRQEKPYPEDLNLQDSDTVICSTGTGTLGRVGQIFGDYPDTTFDSHVTLVRANERFGKQYLFQLLKARQTYLMGMGKGSTNQLELSRGTIQDLEIYVPSEKVLDQFEQVAQPIHDKINIISKCIMQLQTARDRLLPKLMSGEVEV
ncbi:restriction endonuclease subunit S [Evtepia sp.]|uniref:restriction endonuclease subunit S n=1 Tax=Evtepia sp. TaxID=2773933 RepID=UPI003990C366